MQLTRTTNIVDASSAEGVPRPTNDGVWLIDDIANNLDAPKMHQMARKPNSYAISVQSIIGATQNRHGETFSIFSLIAGTSAISTIPGRSTRSDSFRRILPRNCTNGVPGISTPVLPQDLIRVHSPPYPSHIRHCEDESA